MVHVYFIFVSSFNLFTKKLLCRFNIPIDSFFSLLFDWVVFETICCGGSAVAWFSWLENWLVRRSLNKQIIDQAVETCLIDRH